MKYLSRYTDGDRMWLKGKNIGFIAERSSEIIEREGRKAKMCVLLSGRERRIRNREERQKTKPCERKERNEMPERGEEEKQANIGLCFTERGKGKESEIIECGEREARGEGKTEN